MNGTFLLTPHGFTPREKLLGMLIGNYDRIPLKDTGSLLRGHGHISLTPKKYQNIKMKFP